MRVSICMTAKAVRPYCGPDTEIVACFARTARLSVLHFRLRKVERMKQSDPLELVEEGTLGNITVPPHSSPKSMNGREAPEPASALGPYATVPCEIGNSTYWPLCQSGGYWDYPVRKATDVCRGEVQYACNTVSRRTHHGSAIGALRFTCYRISRAVHPARPRAESLC